MELIHTVSLVHVTNSNPTFVDIFNIVETEEKKKKTPTLLGALIKESFPWVVLVGGNVAFAISVV